MSNNKKRHLNSILWFITPSFLGVLFFMLPVHYADQYTIIVAILSQALQSSIAQHLPLIMTMVMCFSLLLSLSCSFWPKKYKKSFLHGLATVSWFWLVIRLLAAVFAVVTYNKLGIHAIYSENTGYTLLYNLLPTIFCVFVFAGLLLPFLLDFGLLEFCGVLASKVMKPLFTLPGRASVDCLASFIGDGTIAVSLTNKQYIQGHYTSREAAVIGTTFSLVSISFSVIILTELKLMAYTVPFYLTIIFISILCAIIMPRIPPLSRKKDDYYNSLCDHENKELIPEGKTALKWAWHLALLKAKKHESMFGIIISGLKNILEMWVVVIPTVMAFGTVALIIAEYTPLFVWIGIPLVPVLDLLKIPNSDILSQAVVISFADMFLPTILTNGLESEFARFVAGTLSICQVIFMSEVGGLLLGSRIPVTFKDLVCVFIIRTMISLPIIALVGHIIYS